MQIEIRQDTRDTNDVFAAKVHFNGEDNGFPCNITPRIEFGQEPLLTWYYQEWLQTPHLNSVNADRAVRSIHRYGKELFRQVFAYPRAFLRYREGLVEGIETLRFAVIGDRQFQTLHWESLWDPNLSEPFAVSAPIIRRRPNPIENQARVRSSATLNLLIVAARSGEKDEFGYRTLTRPLIETLRQNGIRTRIDICRPGTYENLSHVLNARRDASGAGYYHLVHFDAHSIMASGDEAMRLSENGKRWEVTNPKTAQSNRAPLRAEEPQQGFLLMASDRGTGYDSVRATDLAALLSSNNVPLVILGTSPSAPAQKRNETTSLAFELIESGVQTVLAMAYGQQTSALPVLIPVLYKHLLTKGDLSSGVCIGRRALWDTPERSLLPKRSLHDWLLPVVYQNRESNLKSALVPDFLNKADRTEFEQHESSFTTPRLPEQHFFGREVDILQLETRFLRDSQSDSSPTLSNILLVKGRGGQGKSTLLRYLPVWWRQTGLIQRVFYFGYDELTYSAEEILCEIARRLLTHAEFMRDFEPISLTQKQIFIARRLVNERHLLILDNLESVTSEFMAVQNPMIGNDLNLLHDLLRALRGGKTMVLLGSRTEEQWLAPGTFEENIYDLSGLDPEATRHLTLHILRDMEQTHWINHPDLSHLIGLLDGNPLALSVVLNHLGHQTPTEILDHLLAGSDTSNPMGRVAQSETILRCIEYTHSNLDTDKQLLLLCLAPFEGTIDLERLPQYTSQLKQQHILMDLPLARMWSTVQQAIKHGLLCPDPDKPSSVIVPPVLTYFLRGRLRDFDPQITEAIFAAFAVHRDEAGGNVR